MKRYPEPSAQRCSARARICWIAAVVITLVLPLYVKAGISVESLTIEKKALPGETYQGSFAVTNTGDKPQEVSLYQTDYSFASDGSNRYNEPGQDPRSNAGWIIYSPHRVEIPPHQVTQVSYVVHVPDDSQFVGTYWSMIMVEEVPPSQPDSLIHLANYQTQIRQVVRYGVQCVTNVGIGGAERAAFTFAQLLRTGDAGKELRVDVANTGDRLLVPHAWAELYDQNGRRVGRFAGEQKRVYPGTSVRLRFDLGNLPGGKYKALVVLDNGEQNVFGAKYDLEF
jgi:hypothetical protein